MKAGWKFYMVINIWIMIIYDKSDNLLLDIPVDDTSYRYRAIRQGDKVYLYFSLTEHVTEPVYQLDDNG